MYEKFQWPPPCWSLLQSVTSGGIVCYPITATSRFWMCHTICWMVLHLQAFLSLCRRCNLFTVIRDLKIQRCDGNENVQKTRGLISKTTTLHMHQAFLYIYLPFFVGLNYGEKIPNFVFYGERKQATTKFCFAFWTWTWSLGIHIQEGWWLHLNERMQINFLSNVLVAVTLCDLKVPR